MTKYYKQNSDLIPFHVSSTSSIRQEPTPQRIPQQLTILYSLPLNKTSGALFRKKQYLIRKLYLPDDPLTTPRLIRTITRPKKSYITKLDTDANKSFKFLKITKDLKSLRKITFTAYTKNPDKITLKVWRGFNSAHITSMSIGYPYLADPSVLFRIISYHRHLKELIYERLFSQLVSSDSKRCHFNIKRYLNLWETRFPEMLQSFRTYMSLISPQNIEPLTLKLTSLSTLELESNNEVEDTSLTRLVSQLHNIPALSSVSLVFSDCYSQQFLLTLFNSLARINNLHDLTILLPLCISQPAKSPFPLHNNFAQLQVLNLAISRTHRGHEHFDCEETLLFYEFFKDLHLPRLRKLRLHLESALITKQRQGYDELAIFLQFLGTLAPTLELLNIRFWGPSLEYYHWERVTNTISTLEKLESLELSEVSYFNNFCVGLLAKMVSKLPKLRDLRLRPVNMTKLRYLKSFVDAIESHGAIQVLYLMISRLSIDYTKRLLVRLKEFRLRTNFGREKQDFQELFENAGRRSVMKSVLYQCAPW